MAITISDIFPRWIGARGAFNSYDMRRKHAETCRNRDERNPCGSSAGHMEQFEIETTGKSEKAVMGKIALIVPLLIGALLSQACSSLITLAKIDRNCPTPSEDQLKDGYLRLQKGLTLKCQIKNYTHRMPCMWITNSTGIMDGWMCSSGGRNILFIFDENDILKEVLHPEITDDPQ
jgi:hypothetical protein